jgi:hypothetical protein
MSSKRLFYGMLVVIGLLIVGLIVGAYGADRLLQSQSKQLVSDKLQTSVLSQEQTELIRAKQDIKKYQSLATITQAIVPQDKDQAETVLQLVNIANANGVALGSITFPSSSLGQAVGHAAGSTATLNLSQLAPVLGIPGVYNLQLIVQSDASNPVPYSSFINFLNALENNRRTALISEISVQPDAKNRNTVTFTLTLDEYIKP